MKLKGKKILLGITGSIAAYKSAVLLRLLVKEGADVCVLMTDSAKDFIGPVTLSALSGKPVLSSFSHTDTGLWNSHVEMGLWADIFIIAPATANTIAKMATGICDNILLTTYMSVRCPVAVAPAMDCDMFNHPSLRKNLETLKSFGNIILEPGSGQLASGLEGKGRMQEPEQIVNEISNYFEKENKLSGKLFIVTAGPTYEAIDPVRFIGNYSSGKMGYAIAEELVNYGAEVILISGPSNLDISNKKIKLIKVQSAEQMFNECIVNFKKADGAVMAAAVADYTPEKPGNAKLKRTGDSLNITLKPTRDIAAELGKMKKKNQILIGFALETNNEIENAKKKLKNKNLDFIVLNSLNDKGAGFNTDTNKITIVHKDLKSQNFELKSKSLVAADIVENIVNLF